MMKRTGIRWRVALLTLVPSLVMVISLETFFLYSRFSDLDQDLMERGKLIARQLASSSEYGVFSNNQAFLQNIAQGVLQQPDVRGLVILNPASETLVKAGVFSSPIKNAGRDNALQPVSTLHEEVSLLNPIRSTRESLWIYQPIIPAQVALDDFESRPSIRQAGGVIIEMDRFHTERTKSRMFWYTVLATGLFLVFSLYLVYLASRSISSPIRRLSEAVRAIGEGNLDTRVSLQTGVDELGTLAQGMNRMATQLQHERSILQQRIEEATQLLRAKKEEAERASHDKSRFLAVASHDLRQPLHALGLYVAELQRKAAGTEQQHLVGQIEHSIEALSTLLNALLDISKLDAGVVVPQIQICDVSTILERVTADYRILAGIKNIRLVVRPFGGYITSDPMLLERILMNLVSNAVRYTYPNGSVLVACRRRGRFLRIEVRDSGVGISGMDQENIFREFFQLAQPQLDVNKGLGLGLSIVDRLARLLGHRIELRSALGRGSVFAIEVPIAPQSARLPEVAATLHADSEEIEKSSLTGKRLLVVDDDALVLSSTSGILASWGCEVSSAASISQVRQFLREGVSWDLVITDYQLDNEGSGIDVIALIRQHHNKQIPCILISGDIGPAVLKLASVGGHHLLHKPVRPAKLRSLMVYLLESATPSAA
jgi:signal transduction histidine kinase/CheY-like chemotaxis protein